MAHRIRLPLPWSGLDHVHSYALEGSPGWTLVDAGLADLVDPGSFEEYGSLVLAAQRGRRLPAQVVE